MPGPKSWTVNSTSSSSALRADADALAGVAVLEGVLDEVAEDLVHGVGIGHDQRVGRADGLELHAGVDDDAPRRFDGILNQRAGAHGLQGKLVVGALDAGQGEQIFREAIHAAWHFLR